MNIFIYIHTYTYIFGCRTWVEEVHFGCQRTWVEEGVPQRSGNEFGCQRTWVDEGLPKRSGNQFGCQRTWVDCQWTCIGM
jgi:hypothetical protein